MSSFNAVGAEFQRWLVVGVFWEFFNAYGSFRVLIRAKRRSVGGSFAESVDWRSRPSSITFGAVVRKNVVVTRFFHGGGFLYFGIDFLFLVVVGAFSN